MAGRKRAATDSSSTEKRETRSSKTQKVDNGTKGTTKRKPKGTGALKTGLTTTAFKSRAVPLHVAIGHRPFVGEGETGAADLLASVTLAPTSFATGSYGWKGSKRITVPLRAHGESEPEGEELEKGAVHVTLTINATVIGSKGAKETEGVEEAEEEGGGQKEGAEGEHIQEEHEEHAEHEETVEVHSEEKLAAETVEAPADTT